MMDPITAEQQEVSDSTDAKIIKIPQEPLQILRR